MRSNSREEIVEAFDALTAAMSRVLALDTEVLTTGECVAMLERCERLRRQLPAVEHPMINRVATADATEVGGKPPSALANRLRITRAEASRRIGDAANLGPRRTLTGEPLQPVLPATAAAQRAGELSTAHARVIRGFFERLPENVSLEARVAAEVDLAEYAHTTRPDELRQLADTLTDCLNPDGDFTDTDRARRRTLLLGKQDTDGMSPITGWLDPQARATLDAVLARWAAPGMCNPDHPTPCVSGTPSQDAIESDTRSAGQRNHDALTALGRAMLASGNLGQHNGLPATIIVSTTLADLEAGTGKAHTGGGTWMPISDALRVGSHSHHYLRIYQGAKELALYHTKRIASPAQRIVLYAKDRGCSFPNCDVPGYHTEAHHVTGFAITHDTDINDLTLACGPNHKQAQPGGYTTRKNAHGQTEWIPPPHLDHGQPRINQYHHPERLLRDHKDNEDNEDDGDDGDDGDDDDDGDGADP